MQNHKPPKRTRNWSVSKVLGTIGIVLLLVIVSYMAYDAIDTKARSSFNASRH